jgi:hypothetical protein
MKEWKERGALKRVPVGDKEYRGWKWLGPDMCGPICPLVKYAPGKWVRPPAGHGPLVVFTWLDAALSFGWERILPSPYGGPDAAKATLESYSLWEIQWKPVKRLKTVDGRVLALWSRTSTGVFTGETFEWLPFRTELAGAVKLLERVPKETLMEWLLKFAKSERMFWNRRAKNWNTSK